MAQIITIASGKGGTGKSTLAAGICKALAGMNKKALLIDCAIGLRCLDIILGVDDKVLYTLTDLEQGNCTFEDAAVDCGGFSLISPPQNVDNEYLNRDFLINFTKDLQNDFDFIIIDSGGGIGEDFKSAIAPSDRVILVAEPTPEAIRAVDRTAAVCEQQGKTDLLLVINKINPVHIKKGKQTAISTVIDMLGISTIGLVPDDMLKTKKQNPVIAYTNIAKRLEGEKVPIMEL